MTVPVDLIVGGGTVGLIAFLLLAVVTLWRDHLKNDERREAAIKEITAGWREQSAATVAVAASADRQSSLLERALGVVPVRQGPGGHSRI